MLEMKIPERLKILPCCLKCRQVGVGYKKDGDLRKCMQCNGYVYMYKDFKIAKDPEGSKRLMILTTVGIFFFALMQGESAEFTVWAVFLAGLTFLFVYNHEKNKIKGVESLLLDYMSLNPLKLHGKVGPDDSFDGVVGSDNSPDGPMSIDDSLLKLLDAAEKRGPEVDETPIYLDPERQAYDDFSKWRADYLAADPIRQHFSDAQIGETYEKMKEAKDFELWKAGYLAENPVRKQLSDSLLKEIFKNTDVPEFDSAVFDMSPEEVQAMIRHRQEEAENYKNWKSNYLAGDPIRKHFNDDQLQQTYHRQKNR